MLQIMKKNINWHWKMLYPVMGSRKRQKSNKMVYNILYKYYWPIKTIQEIFRYGGTI